MPFTPTHVLAILPVASCRRLGLPLSALVIGSMVPDFPLFVPLGPDYATTHSAAGIFTGCLPLGLASFLLFQRVMKRPLWVLLPAVVRRRTSGLVQGRPELSGRSLAAVSAALVIGAATHVFWDSFTHRGCWGTRQLPVLNEPALRIGGHAVPGYKLLQYGSTLVGLPCLALGLWAWLSRRQPEPDREPRGAGDLVSKTGTVRAHAAAVAVAALAAAVPWQRPGASRYARLGQSITSAGLALMLTALTYCLIFTWRQRRIARAGRGQVPPRGPG